MGFRFRKSINLGGGAKINLSKSGVGFSWGTKGMRFTKKATGGKRTTFSIPGTGISHVTETSKSSKKKTINSKSDYVAKTNEMTSTDSNLPKVPFYKRTWFILLVILVLLSAMYSCFDNDDKEIVESTSSSTTIVTTESQQHTIKLVGGVQGEYGRYVELYGVNGLIETKLEFAVPAGNYIIKNYDHDPWIQFNIYSEEKILVDGNEEQYSPEGFSPILLKVGESVEVTIPEGYLVYISDTDSVVLEQQL